MQNRVICTNAGCPIAFFRRSGPSYERIPTTVKLNGARLFEMACGGATGIIFTGPGQYAAHLWTYKGGDFKDVKDALEHKHDYISPDDVKNCE